MFNACLHQFYCFNITQYFNATLGGKTLKHYRFLSTLCLSFTILSPLYADSILKYELKRPNGETVQQTISIDGRWLRLDIEPKAAADYILIDTGRQIKFDVYNSSKSYQATRMGKLYWPQSSDQPPRFKPLKKVGNISGARCQQVEELAPSGETVLKHCMSSTGPLGLNSREMITLTRLFMLGRRLNVGWPAIGTQDERQASVFSQAKDGTVQKFISAWHGKIPYTKLKIPDGYKRITPDLPDPSVLPELRKEPIAPLKPEQKHRYNQD